MSSTIDINALEPVQREIVEEFEMFSSWSERYQYLIDLAKSLPTFPAELKDAEHLLTGCQSQVFVHTRLDDGGVEILAISDSSIVSGLIALVLRVYSGRPPQEIIDTEPEFIDAIGLRRNLSVTRKNGLASLIAKIKSDAQTYLS